MNILSVSKEKREAVVQLDSTELVALCNALYRISQTDYKRAILYQLQEGLMIARDLSQYGHIDGFCLRSIINCRDKQAAIKQGE